MMTPERTLKTSALADTPPPAKSGRDKKAVPEVKGTAGKTSPQGYSPIHFGNIIKFFSSLRLTVVCLGLGLILVFAGTLAQVDIGLCKAQNEFFRSFFI